MKKNKKKNIEKQQKRKKQTKTKKKTRNLAMDSSLKYTNYKSLCYMASPLHYCSDLNFFSIKSRSKHHGFGDLVHFSRNTKTTFIWKESPGQILFNFHLTYVFKVEYKYIMIASIYIYNDSFIDVFLCARSNLESIVILADFNHHYYSPI